MKVYSYPVTIYLASQPGGAKTAETTVEAVNRANAVRMALVRAGELGLPVNVPQGATLGSILKAGHPVKVGPGTFSHNA